MAVPRATMNGLSRLRGSVPSPLSGSELWHHTERAKKLASKGKRTCVECGATLSRYNPQTSCWSHDHE